MRYWHEYWNTFEDHAWELINESEFDDDMARMPTGASEWVEVQVGQQIALRTNPENAGIQDLDDANTYYLTVSTRGSIKITIRYTVEREVRHVHLQSARLVRSS